MHIREVPCFPMWRKSGNVIKWSDLGILKHIGPGIGIPVGPDPETYVRSKIAISHTLCTY